MNIKPGNHSSLLLGVLLVCLMPQSGWAEGNFGQDSSLRMSGFITLNYSVSNSKVPYDRKIDSNGTIEASSIAGVQITKNFSPTTWATTQLAIAPDGDSERGLVPVVRWAYLGHDFGDGIELRIGRQQVNIYKNSENLEIGSTHVLATLPKEIYIFPGFPTNDGISIRKRCLFDDGGDADVGAAYGVKTLGIQQRNSQGQTTSYARSRFKGGNIFAHYNTAGGQSFFGGYTWFNSDMENANGPIRGSGEVITLANSGKVKDYNYELEFSNMTTKQNLVLNGGALQIKVPDFIANGYSATVYRSIHAFTPFVNYARLLAKTDKPYGQWTVKAGSDWRYNNSTIWKAELAHIRSSPTGGITFFTAPDGETQQVNIFTLSYNKLF